MRIALLTVVLTLLFVTASFPQPQIVMQNEDVTSWTQRSYDVSLAQDRSVAQVFRVFDWPGELLYLRNIDESGTELWRVTVDSFDSRSLNYRKALVETLWDGSIVVAFSVNNDRNQADLRRDIVVKRYAINGALMWTYDTHDGWPAIDKYLCDLTILGNDTIAVAGYYSYPRSKYLLKLNAMSGNQTSFVAMNGGGTRRIAATITDSTVVYGYYSHVTKHAHNGDLLWTYDVDDGEVVSVTQDPDGNVYALSHDRFTLYSRTKIDPNGELVWRQQRPYVDGKHGSITYWKDNLTILYWNGGTVQVCDGQGMIGWTNELLEIGGQRHPVVVVGEDELLFGYSGWADYPDDYRLGVVQYWIPDQDVAGQANEHVISIPPVFELGAACPNPFNSSTTMTLTTPSAGPVQVAVYDVLGREVDYWSINASGAGVVPITWSAHDLASGVYMIQLLTPDGQRATQRVTLVR